MHVFNFEGLTIGDARDFLLAASTNDLIGFLVIVAKCYEGDIYAQPLAQMSMILSKFSRDMRAYSDMHQDTDVSDGMRLLKRMFEKGHGDG